MNHPYIWTNDVTHAATPLRALLSVVSSTRCLILPLPPGTRWSVVVLHSGISVKQITYGNSELHSRHVVHCLRKKAAVRKSVALFFHTSDGIDQVACTKSNDNSHAMRLMVAQMVSTNLDEVGCYDVRLTWPCLHQSNQRSNRTAALEDLGM